MIYVDTSVFVSALTNEPSTALCQSWIASQEKGTLLTSAWTIAEFSAALSVKARTGQIAAETCGHVREEFDRLCVEALDLLEVGGHHFRRAALLSGAYALGLRAGDSLHLAICQEKAKALCTRDKRMALAAGRFGLDVVQL